MKIAITSTDGKTVNQHFGKADKFFIYKMENCGLSFVEERTVNPYCKDGEEQPKDHGFDENRFFDVFEAINDCETLYTNQIGDTPLSKLKGKGIEVQLCSCEISLIGGCGCNCS